MADTNANPLDAVSSLLEERQRYENWIASLESRKATTPPHVYARVHADYERRLEEVLQRLSSRTGELESATGELRLRIDRMQEEENAKRDERAEAELRAMVGEYSDEQWVDVRSRSDSEINRLSGEVSKLREELTRLEGLLKTANAPKRSGETSAVAPAPAPAPKPEPARVEAPAERAVPVAQSTERAPEPPAPQEAPRAPEMSPQAAVQPPSPPAPVAQPVSPPRPAEEPRKADPIPDTRAFDELAFLKSVVEPRDSARLRVPAPAEPAPAAQAAPPAETRPEPRIEPREQPQRTTVPGRRPATPPETAAAVPPAHIGGPDTRESVPTFLRDVPNEQAKTLKCQECGTMNYPTEWYCERCGGELAAM